MATYKLEVTTGNLDLSGTLDHIFITLFGEDGESERTELEKLGSEFVTGAVSSINLTRTKIVRDFNAAPSLQTKTYFLNPLFQLKVYGRDGGISKY